jgi:hypothetical protein
MNKVTRLSFHVMTHHKYTTQQIASALEAVACSIRDGQETGCVKIEGKTAGYWAYDNPNKEFLKIPNKWD